MGILKNVFGSDDRESVLSQLLDDLTNLEVNTVVKDGMLASPGRKRYYDIVKDIFDKYRIKFERIILKYPKLDLKKDSIHYLDKTDKWQKMNPVKEENWGPKEGARSFENLYARLLTLEKVFQDNKHIHISDREYTVFRRMASFCKYIKTLEDEIVPGSKTEEDKGDKIHIYKASMTDKSFFYKPEPDVRLKLKRMRDLGTESIVMQTRVGIDGDVITRIEKDFAENSGSKGVKKEDVLSAKELVVQLHEQHIDISLKYWKSMVFLVKDFIQSVVSSGTSNKAS
jgi:hypothetical protein